MGWRSRGRSTRRRASSRRFGASDAVVALGIECSETFLRYWLACAQCGACAAPLNGRWDAAAAAAAARDAGAAVVILDDAHDARWSAAAIWGRWNRGVPSVARGGGRGDEDEGWTKAYGRRADDACAMCYTSGTVGGAEGGDAVARRRVCGDAGEVGGGGIRRGGYVSARRAVCITSVGCRARTRRSPRARITCS